MEFVFQFAFVSFRDKSQICLKRGICRVEYKLREVSFRQNCDAKPLRRLFAVEITSDCCSVFLSKRAELAGL